MRPVGTGVSKARYAFVLGTLALTGCIPGGFVYDLTPERYYSSGNAYYSTPHSGYYGQPTYYGQPNYVPLVVYRDHDHDRNDCRHEGHRDRAPGNDHDAADAPAARPHPRRPPPSSVAPVPPPARPDASESRAPVRRAADTRAGSRAVVE